ncbi:MAG: hypothetical protein M3O62_05920 [Pseudomonadota bacterium]|nr:hypothetical protein [Pseudomonadota bacterium]
MNTTAHASLHQAAPDLAVHLNDRLRPCFGHLPVVGDHGLTDHPLFTDAALVDLLDHFPREHLYALNMGNDPTRVEDNQLALHDGVSGAELMQAVRSGRLWLNVTRVDRASSDYRDLIHRLYHGLSDQVPDFSPSAVQGTLLISSPHALVYYHADGPASALWHIRGRKRVWVYPAQDDYFVKQDMLEDIFAGARHEYLPYQQSYDCSAEVYDLEPGQWISWPQNAPHRVTNLDSVNVSLSTEHFTAASLRRFRLFVANRFFRTRLHCKDLSAQEDGVCALAKILVQRCAGKLGLNPVEIRRQTAALRVSTQAPGGIVPLDAAFQRARV